MEKLSSHLKSFISATPDANGCWNWLGAPNMHGYGNYTFPHYGKQVSAHRVVYEALIGPIPEDMDLDHLCKNRKCVNPEHLEPVTRAVNLRRGRMTKLTEEKVREIKRAILEGFSHQVLAVRYHVSTKTIWQIHYGRAWKDVKIDGGLDAPKRICS